MDRRHFLSSTTLLLAGVSVGAVTLTGCEGVDVHALGSAENLPATSPRNAGFGWSIPQLDNTSAYALFRVTQEVRLLFADIDASYRPSQAGESPASAQARCRAWVSRGQAPGFGGVQASAAGASPPSASFGAIEYFNPAKLTVAGDAAPLQDVFYSVVLRSWVPRDGTTSQAARVVSTRPSVTLHVGDFLVFGIDHQGVPGDVGVQAVLGFA
jgi:hypothetical protein